MISAAAFRRAAKKGPTFELSIHDIDIALSRETMENRNPAGEPAGRLEGAQTKQLIPEDLHDFATLFSEVEANMLPPHRTYDHKITLKPDFQVPFGPLYSLSRPELEELRRWLDENLKKGFIRQSSSPAGAPILFVKKKDVSLRLCADYRGLNEGTIKDRYPLPLIRETLTQLSRAKYYTTLDIRAAYNLVRMAEGEE